MTGSAEGDHLLKLVQLSLGGLHAADEIQEGAVVWIEHSELLV